jgi:hypothetical protein
MRTSGRDTKAANCGIRRKQADLLKIASGFKIVAFDAGPQALFPRRWTLLSTVCMLLWAMLLPLPGWAQNGPPTQSPLQQLQGQQGIGIFDHPGYEDEVRHERVLQALNADRQKSLVSDTLKLLKLANELNAEVNGGNPDTLTANQLRKLEQIEKLAHSVKEKMSTSVRGVPPFHMPDQGMQH